MDNNERVRGPTITRLVRDLERDGLVTRRPDPHDARAWSVRITPAGRRLVDHSRARKLALFKAHLARQPHDVLRAIDTALDCLAALEDDVE